MNKKTKISKQDFDRMEPRLRLVWLERMENGEAEIEGLEPAGSVYDDDSDCVVCWTPYLDDEPDS